MPLGVGFLPVRLSDPRSSISSYSGGRVPIPDVNLDHEDMSVAYRDWNRRLGAGTDLFDFPVS